MAGRFVIKQTKTGTKFDLKAANGEVIASSEVYSSEAACKNGIESVRTNAPKASVEDQTQEGFVTGESYKTKAACENGIDSVKRHAAEADVVKEAE